VPGATIDKTFVAAEVARICAEHDVQELVFDTAQIADFEAACEEIGFPAWRFKGPDAPEGEGLKMVAHAQGTRVCSRTGNIACRARSSGSRIASSRRRS
jgi:hypothetical protein